MLRTLIYALGRIFPALVGLGGVAYYTHVLDPASLGTYAVFVSCSLVFSAIGYTWLRVAALRFAAGDAGTTQPDLKATVLLAFAAVSVILIAFQATFLHFYRPEAALSTLLLALAATVGSGWNDLNATVLQGYLRPIAWGRVNFLRAVIAFGTSASLIYAGLRTDALLAGFVAGNIGSALLWRTWIEARHGKMHFDLLKRCFHFGWPQSVSTAQNYFAPAFQRGYLLAFGGATAVGVMAVAQDFANQTIASLVGAVSLAGIPLAYKAKDADDTLELDQQLRANASVIFATGVPVVAGLIAFNYSLSHIIFGSRFWNGSGQILTLIAVSAVLVNFRIFYFDQAFELSRNTGNQAVISSAAVGISIALSCLLIPRYSAVGAAISLIIANAIAIVLSVMLGRRELPMPIPVFDWVKTLIASACAVGVALKIPQPQTLLELGIAGSACLITYVFVSLLLRSKLVLAVAMPRIKSTGGL